MAGSHDYVLGRKDLAAFILNYVFDATPDPTLAVQLARAILRQELEAETPPRDMGDLMAEAFKRR